MSSIDVFLFSSAPSGCFWDFQFGYVRKTSDSKLLQELRTRKVPKSSSLNLTCLVVQVQRTKMQVFLRLVGLLALPCLKAFFKFLLQMYELGSWAGQVFSLVLDNKDDEVRVSRTSVTSISLRREGADIHVDVGLCITQAGLALGELQKENNS
ncbi:hypothetical protein ACE6H2_003668 [Prunus campanulata]